MASIKGTGRVIDVNKTKFSKKRHLSANLCIKLLFLFSIECDYDGGDCCLDTVITTRCENCLCLGGGKKNRSNNFDSVIIASSY